MAFCPSWSSGFRLDMWLVAKHNSIWNRVVVCHSTIMIRARSTAVSWYIAESLRTPKFAFQVVLPYGFNASILVPAMWSFVWIRICRGDSSHSYKDFGISRSKLRRLTVVIVCRNKLSQFRGTFVMAIRKPCVFSLPRGLKNSVLSTEAVVYL